MLGVLVSLPERLRTGRKMVFPKQDADENDQVVLILTPLMSSQDGSKDAPMDYRFTERLKSKDIQERRKQYIVSWCHCVGSNESSKRLLCLMLPCRISRRKMPSGGLYGTEPN